MEMELKWIRTSTKTRQKQQDPWNLCTEALVSRSMNQNRGTQTGTMKPQEHRFQYQTGIELKNQNCTNTNIYVNLEQRLENKSCVK